MQIDFIYCTDEKSEVWETLVVYPVSHVFYVAEFSLKPGPPTDVSPDLACWLSVGGGVRGDQACLSFCPLFFQCLEPMVDTQYMFVELIHELVNICMR